MLKLAYGREVAEVPRMTRLKEKFIITLFDYIGGLIQNDDDDDNTDDEDVFLKLLSTYRGILSRYKSCLLYTSPSPRD